MLTETCRVVIDTNVWLDWLLFDDPSAQVLESLAQKGSLQCPTTAATRREWHDVIARDVFSPALLRVCELRETAIEQLIDRYDRLTNLCEHPLGCPLFCSDRDDQVFLDLAVQERSQFLLSRDRALLKLAPRARRHYGLHILTPLAFGNQLAGLF